MTEVAKIENVPNDDNLTISDVLSLIGTARSTGKTANTVMSGMQKKASETGIINQESKVEMITIKHRWMKCKVFTVNSTIIAFNENCIAKVKNLGNAIVDVESYIRSSHGLAEIVSVGESVVSEPVVEVKAEPKAVPVEPKVEVKSEVEPEVEIVEETKPIIEEFKTEESDVVASVQDNENSEQEQKVTSSEVTNLDEEVLIAQDLIPNEDVERPIIRKVPPKRRGRPRKEVDSDGDL